MRNGEGAYVGLPQKTGGCFLCILTSYLSATRQIPATIKRRDAPSSKKFQSSSLFLSLHHLRLRRRLLLHPQQLAQSSSATAMHNPQSSLPPGFRFHPTDEELVLHYLTKKVTSMPVPVSIIAEVDIYKFDPWDLPGKALFGDKEWYFFSPRDRKYPNGVRPNRAAASGYWKATGTDKTIVPRSSIGGGGGVGNIGVKKALVFYQGRPPKGIKTNWIMHEYRLVQPHAMNKPPLKLRDSSMRLDDWVLCRIYKKSHAISPAAAAAAAATDDDQEHEDSFMEESLRSQPNQSAIQLQKPPSLSTMLDAMDSSILSHLLSDVHYPSPTGNYGSSSTVGQSRDILPVVPHWNQVTNMENQLKRQHSSMDGDVPCPSKKLASSFTFTSNVPTQSDLQQSLLNQSFFNQGLLLNPYLQFQG